MEKCMYRFVGESQRNRPLVRPRRKYKGNIEINLGYAQYKGENFQVL
jgi:hypothetical protein